MRYPVIDCTIIFLAFIQTLSAQEPAVPNPSGTGFRSATGVYQPYTMPQHKDVKDYGEIPRNFEHRLSRASDDVPGLQRKYASSVPKFILPLRMKEGLAYPGFWTITAYVDHDTLYPGHLSDYQCGELTYDLESGYNHSGTDFFLWPFPWYAMDHDDTEVVAVAPGVIIHKQDGNFDRHCEENTDPWNAIALRHDDGTMTWYGHLKSGSLTPKEAGDPVAAGEYLGVVGSSGSSLAPHLHFEVYDAQYRLIDPFAGPCNITVTESWWADQIPYLDPGVNRITTNHKLPVFPECPQQEIPNESTSFVMGDTIFLLSYFRNIDTGDQVEIIIRRPDQSVWDSWHWNSPWQFYTASWLWFFIILTDEQEGTWTYELTYKNIMYDASFDLFEEPGIAESERVSLFRTAPNPVNDLLWIYWDEPSTVINRINLKNVEGISYCTDYPVPNVHGQEALDVSGLPGGLYILEIQAGDIVHRKKIIVH
ncbi:MAG: peptidoglycan DD-metalloendopeptidase family protein [Bacteroidales bacterium]|nr:peptidoglycan DD-metalloendopeptidase family protein [Bacteroidales bacterium]